MHIGTLQAEEARSHLDGALRRLLAAGVDVRLTAARRGAWTFLTCHIRDAPETQRQARAALIEALAEFILGTCQRRLLRRLAATRYSYFSAAERVEIVSDAERDLPAAARRQRVRARLREYLEGQDTLIVEGFLTFRLRDLVGDAEDALDAAVDTFLLRREYREFIELLHHFVQTLPPRRGLVHMVVLRGGAFRVIDPDGRPLPADGGVPSVPTGIELAPEDRIISALVTLAPRQVVVHRPAGDASLAEPGVAAVRDVFGSRLRLCGGCPICELREEPRGGV